MESYIQIDRAFEWGIGFQYMCTDTSNATYIGGLQRWIADFGGAVGRLMPLTARQTDLHMGMAFNRY